MMGGGGKAKDVATAGGAAVAAGAASSAAAVAAAAKSAAKGTKGKVEQQVQDVPVVGADSAVKSRQKSGDDGKAGGKEAAKPPSGKAPVDSAVRAPALEPEDIEVLEVPPRGHPREEL
jgi:hypothetical protein